MKLLDNLLWTFLNRNVAVRMSKTVEATGKLVAILEDERNDHKPSMLVLEDMNGFILCRGTWITISASPESPSGFLKNLPQRPRSATYKR